MPRTSQAPASGAAPDASPAPWWLAHRDVSALIDPPRAEPTILTLVFAPAGTVAASAVGTTGPGSIRDALFKVEASIGSLPAVIVCAADVVPVLRGSLPDAGAVQVEAGELPDAVAETVDSLALDLAGRPQPAPDRVPSGEERHLLYDQVLAFLKRRPWARRADDEPLILELRVGSERRDFVAFVLGGAETMQSGLLLLPGRDVVAATRAVGPVSTQIPAGALSVQVDDAPRPDHELARVRRHGWPEDEPLIPLVLAHEDGGPAEPDARAVRTVAVAVAAVLDHDARAGEAVSETAGGLELPDGRRGRWRVREPAAAAASTHERLLGGRISGDLVPDGARVALGAIPWAALPDLVAGPAWSGEVPVEMPQAPEGLPIVGIDLGDAASAARVAERLRDAQPVGVLAATHDDRALLVLVGERAMLGLATVAADDAGLERFRRRRAATDGSHAILVGDLTAAASDPTSLVAVIGCRLLDEAPPELPATAERRSRR